MGEEEHSCPLVHKGVADGRVFDGPYHLTPSDLMPGRGERSERRGNSEWRKREETRVREREGDSHQFCGYASIAHHHYPPGTDQPLLEVLGRQTRWQ